MTKECVMPFDKEYVIYGALLSVTLLLVTTTDIFQNIHQYILLFGTGVVISMQTAWFQACHRGDFPVSNLVAPQPFIFHQKEATFY